MAARKLIVFKHDGELGNVPAHKLFDLVKVQKNCGDAPPRSFGDYNVTVDMSSVPHGVAISEMI
jgi:CRISPR-associated protein Csd2